MSLQLILTGTSHTFYFSDLHTLVLEKEIYTPYSQLTVTVYDTDSPENLLDINRAELLSDSTQLHLGTIEQLSVTKENGIIKLQLTSRGLTAMLLQNQLKPGIHTEMSLDRLMTEFYTFPEDITWEENSDTSNYIYVKQNVSMWDGIANLSYKLYQTYPFIRGANKIRITLPTIYRRYSASSDRSLIRVGMINDQSLLYSDFYMADASGTYGAYHENEPEATDRGLVRTKQLALDQQYLYDPQEALAFRRKFTDRRLQRFFFEIAGVSTLSLGDRITYGSVLSRAVLTRIRIVGDDKGLRTLMEAYADGFYAFSGT